MKPSQRIALLSLVLVGIVAVAPPLHAQAHLVVGRLLLQGAKWLAGAYAAHELGKEIDKATGEDFETQLKAAETNLVDEIKRGSPDHNSLKFELDAVRRQLTMLDSLMRDRPTERQIEGYRQQLAADIERILTVLQDHGLRIEKLEKDMATVLSRLDSLEREQADSSALSEDFAPPRPTLNESSWRRSGRGFPRGVTLEILVTGDSNSIDISETDDWETADLGSFSVSGRGQHAAFRMLRGTGAVVRLLGDNHTVFRTRGLCGRARVHNESRGSKLTGCN